MFRFITIDFSQKSPHFSLLSPTSPCELFEREVTSPSNLKVVGALDNYSLVFVIFINFVGQLKDWVGQVLFLVSCPKGQVEKYVNVEAWIGQVNCKQIPIESLYFCWHLVPGTSNMGCDLLDAWSKKMHFDNVSEHIMFYINGLLTSITMSFHVNASILYVS